METKTSIRISEETKSISIYDNTDPYNDTRAFNRNTRSFKKAVTYINENIEKLQTMGMFKVMNILDNDFKMNMHSYCAMD